MKRAIKLISVSSEEQAKREKVSLEYQSERLDEAAAQYGWTWVDVIAVRGFSRDYYTVAEFVAEAGPKHPDVYRLQDHWKRGDFDVLAVYDGSRFGRKKSMFAEVVGRTYDAGAVIYTTKEGLIDRSNADFFALLGGYAAEKELRVLKERTASGMRRRAELGLPKGTVIRTHRLIRDENGKPIRLEFDQRQRKFWDDVEQLLRDEVGWKRLEEELAARYGYTTLAGKPLVQNTVYRLMRSPTFWGHIAIGFEKKRLNWQKNASWVWDVNDSVPDGVTMFRDTHEPVYPGERYDQMVALLAHHSQTHRGRWRNRAYGTNRFAGLCICGVCGNNLSYKRKRSERYVYLRCSTGTFESRCANYKHIPIPQFEAFIERFMEDAMRSDAAFSQPQDKGANRLRQLEQDCARLRDEISQLIEYQISASPSLRGQYANKITERDQQLITVTAELNQLRSHAVYDGAEEREQVRRQIEADGGLPALWQKPDHIVNQTLHALLGPYRFVALDGEIVELRREK